MKLKCVFNCPLFTLPLISWLTGHSETQHLDPQHMAVAHEMSDEWINE